MKYWFLSLLLIFCWSCVEQSQKPKKDLVDKKPVPNYDSLKFNNKIYLDTIGCMWMVKNVKIIDSLSFEKAFFRVTTDTFLATVKYARLWDCNIPGFLKVPNDTVLISGFVYDIHPYAHGPGYPAIIKEIIYQKKDK